MLARGFIEVHQLNFKFSTYIAIEHIIRVKTSSTTGTSTGKLCAEIIMNGSPGPESSNRIKTKQTPDEIMTLINKERELIRAMEKAAS